MIRGLVIAACLVVVPARAHADARAEAILLFDQGHAAMKAGKYAEACRAFERSDSIYPDSGTRGSLARCYEKLDRLASSWLLWRELADTAPSAALRKDAGRQAARLEPKVPKYILVVPKGTPGMTLTINGAAAAVTGLPVPVDAGKVIAVASAAGYAGWKSELTAVDGKTITIEIPVLEPIPIVDTRPPPPPPPMPKPIDPGAGRRRAAFIAGGVGIATLVGGTVFGLRARGTFGDAEDTCGGDIDRCDPSRLAVAQAQVDDARGQATVSTVMFAIGGAAVVTGAVLWLTAPRATEQPRAAVVPTFGRGTAGVAISGAW